MLYESCAVRSVFCVTFNASSKPSIDTYWSATDDTSAISAALRACAVARYCASAWSFRLWMRPKKSISHDALSPTEYSLETVLPSDDRLRGVRDLLCEAAASIDGNSSERVI